MRRRMMDLIFGGDGVIKFKYGYFDMTNPQYPEKEVYQIREVDYKVEIETDLSEVPDRIVCIYVDTKETVSAGTNMFYGNSILNGSVNMIGKSTGYEGTAFSNTGTYLNFDIDTKKIVLHEVQWRYIKCGKWMWIAIYNE